MTTEVPDDLAKAVDEALDGKVLAPFEVLIGAVEATHELMHVLGGALHEQYDDLLSVLDAIPGGEGFRAEAAPAIADWLEHTTELQRAWLKEHGIETVSFWCLHRLMGGFRKWSVNANA